ncbi:MAG: hypothetical protein AABM66_00410 [Actinomycetota bacterium]
MPPFGARTPVELRDKGIVTVLGMHRSGTSAIAGMLADHGVELGPVSEQNRFNPRGNREIRELNRLHDRVLERSGGSWWEPPERIRVRRGDYRRRNEIVRSIPGETIGVKDPRLLLVLDLWRDLEPRPIGVIRNPVAVRESLERRAHERPRRHPQLSAAGWDELWLTYNRALLAEHRRKPFPVIDFERQDDLDAQVRGALALHGLATTAESGFFERELVGQGAGDWRSRTSSEALEVWDALAGLATP